MLRITGQYTRRTWPADWTDRGLPVPSLDQFLAGEEDARKGRGVPAVGAVDVAAERAAARRRLLARGALAG